MSRPHRPVVGRGPVSRALLTAASLAAAAVLTACGGGTTPDGEEIPSVQDLWAVARTSAQAATSGHVTGFVTDAATGRTYRLDIEGKVDGSNQRMRLSEDDRGRSTILTVKGRTYVSGDWDFWAAATEPKRADTLKSKHVLVKAAQLEDTERLTISGLLSQQLAGTEPGMLSRFTGSVALRRENDHDVWVLTDGSSRLWVDRETGNLLKIAKDGDGASELTFDKWDEADRFSAPKAAIRLEG